MYRFFADHFFLPLSRIHGLVISAATFLLPIFLQPDFIKEWRQSESAMAIFSTVLALWLIAWLFWPLARLVRVLERTGEGIPGADRVLVAISSAIVAISFACMLLMADAPHALGFLVIFGVAIVGGYIAINLEDCWSVKLGFVPKWFVIFLITFFAPLGSWFVWEITKQKR